MSRRVYILLSVLAFLAALVAGCKKSKFVLEHDRAAAANAADVSFWLKPVEGTAKIHLVHGHATLRFEEVYTANFINMWSVEVLDGNNAVSNSDEVFMQVGDATKKIRLTPFGFVCCAARHMGLDQNDFNLPYPKREGHAYYTLELPDQPGRYPLYIKTHRVSDSDVESDSLAWNKRVTTSDILNVEVMPEDKAWEQSQLSELARTVESEQSNTAAYYSAMEQLALEFHSDEAVSAILKALAQHSDSRMAAVGLANADHADFAYSGLLKLVNDPSYGLSYSDLHTLAFLKLRIEVANGKDPELVYPPPRGDGEQAWIESTERVLKEMKPEMYQACQNKRTEMQSRCRGTLDGIYNPSGQNRIG